MTILDAILQAKEQEVLRLKRSYQRKQSRTTQIPVSLFDTFMSADHMNMIAEIKRASPSKGKINVGVDPVKQALAYQAAGAGMISVLTDEPFFKGTMEDLAAVRSSVHLPLLNKDFIIDPIQIDRAKDHGANVILLIVAALSKGNFINLYHYAINSGLEVLVEVHNERELALAQEIDAKIIGVNNRNLKTFTVDLSVTERLAQYVDLSKTLLISESGIKTGEEIERLQRMGVRGVLVGETVMRSPDLKSTFQTLRGTSRKGG